MPKGRELKRIDIRPPIELGTVTASASASADSAPPSFQGVTPPTNVQLTTAVFESAVTPSAAIGVTWTPSGEYDPVTYRVQSATDSGFTTNVATVVAEQASATLAPLTANTLYYVRVATVYRSQVSDWSTAASITTAQDTTPPAAVSAQAATFINGGDLVVTWTNPTSANLKDVEIKIYASNGGTLLGTFYDRTQRFVWTVRENLAATANVGDPTLYVTLQARSYGNVMSVSTVNASATKSAPSAPTVTLTGGFSVLVAQVTSAAESVYSLFEFVWKRDTVAQRTKETASRDDVFETGASGDEGSHSWTVAVRQKDAFGQYSTATTSSAVVLDALTIEYLRSGAFYSDIDNNTFTPPAGGTLAALKDDNRATGGVTYSA